MIQQHNRYGISMKISRRELLKKSAALGCLTLPATVLTNYENWLPQLLGSQPEESKIQIDSPKQGLKPRVSIWAAAQDEPLIRYSFSQLTSDPNYFEFVKPNTAPSFKAIHKTIEAHNLSYLVVSDFILSQLSPGFLLANCYNLLSQEIYPSWLEEANPLIQKMLNHQNLSGQAFYTNFNICGFYLNPKLANIQSVKGIRFPVIHTNFHRKEWVTQMGGFPVEVNSALDSIKAFESGKIDLTLSQPHYLNSLIKPNSPSLYEVNRMAGFSNSYYILQRLSKNEGLLDLASESILIKELSKIIAANTFKLNQEILSQNILKSHVRLNSDPNIVQDALIKLVRLSLNQIGASDSFSDALRNTLRHLV